MLASPEHHRRHGVGELATRACLYFCALLFFFLTIFFFFFLCGCTFGVCRAVSVNTRQRM